MNNHDPIIGPIRREILNRFAFDIHRLGQPVFESVVTDRAGEKSFGDRAQYLGWLINHPAEKEWSVLMDQLAIKETYFFRNRSQFEFLESRGLREMLGRRTGHGLPSSRPVLRLLSAGCATGEEPYSMAMMMLERLRKQEDWDVTIDAWDISEEALSKAQLGRYSPSERMLSSLYAKQPDLLEKYFQAQRDGSYQVADPVRNLVRFQQKNLKEVIATRDFSERWDVIFCRNVMIYFDDEHQSRLVRWLEDSVKPGGFVMTGDVETLHVFDHRLQPVRWNALVYQRPYDPPASCY